MTDTVRFTLNGAPVAITPRAGESLLHALRERCGILSVKDGCSPQGQCGCCLALVDGRPLVTCAFEARRAEGCEVLTLEGLSARERTIAASAFTAAGGVQCGFCIPGIALRAKHLLDRQPAPGRSEIARAIDGHLCRCTGYAQILDAIELMASVWREGEPPVAGTDGRVGQPLARYDSVDQVLGSRPFVADMQRAGLLHGALVLSAHARARVLRINSSHARALPGVHAVVTADDVPGQRWYGLLHDDWPGFVAEGEEVRCVGDVLAAVAADDAPTARAAAALVEVDYEPLPPVLCAEEALAPGAPQVNPTHPNLLSRSVIRRGDAQAALAASAHVVSGTWQTQRIEHLFLEPEAALAEPLPDGRLALHTQGQGIFDDRRQVARFLGLDDEQVHVELEPSGGAFGGKEDMSVQAQTALLAHVTRRPVKLVLNREESVRVHPKRHPIRLDYSVGCDARGRLTAVVARLVGDSGAYASVGAKVLERAAGHACGPYRVPAVDVEAVAAYTNNPACGAMRGFGVPQAAFAIEGCLDRLAEMVGLDGWEIRSRNAVDVGDAVTSGQLLEKSVGLRRTLEAVKDAYYAAMAEGKAGRHRLRAQEQRHRQRRRGVGQVPAADRGRRLHLPVQRLHRDGPGAADGAGAVRRRGDRPARSAVPAEGRHDVRAGLRTDHGLAGDAVRRPRGHQRGHEAARRPGRGAARCVTSKGRVYAADELTNDTTPLGADLPPQQIKTHTSYGFATQVVVLDTAGRVERVVAAHDVGRVVNPALCRGQIEGSIHMGLGYALTEELPCENGMPVTHTLREIGVLRARDMPRTEVILIEEAGARRPVRRQGRRRDRSRADRCSRGQRAPRLRRGAPHHAADEGFCRPPAR